MYTYIIIDDEKLTRKGTIAKLSRFSGPLECIGEAANGEAGLLLIKELCPDIIITDMKMPLMGGDKLLPVLAERYPEIPIIVISGYRDFEYSRHAIRAKAIDYLLKPFSGEELASAVEGAINRIRENSSAKQHLQTTKEYEESLHLAQDRELLLQLIQGYCPGDIHFSSRQYQFIHQSNSITFILLHSRQSLAEVAAAEILALGKLDQLAVYQPHPRLEELAYLIFFLPEHSSIRPQFLCGRLLEQFPGSLQGAVCCGISASHSSLTQMHQASLESVQALNQMSADTSEKVFLYSGEEQVPAAIQWDKEDRLLFCIEAGDAKRTEQLVTELFDYFHSQAGLTIYDIKCSCFQLTNQAKTMMSRYIHQIQPESVDSSIQNILDTMFTLQELESYYKQFFRSMALALAQENIYSDSNVIRNVQTYIDRNYQKDISVELVASLFRMNRSYLSHLFKKTMGKNFTDYLNEVRIEHAKALLKNTDKKMYQIAKAVGYDNVQYFFRVFKKLERQTPEQYRNRE